MSDVLAPDNWKVVSSAKRIEKKLVAFGKSLMNLVNDSFSGPEVVPDEPGWPAGPAWLAGLAWPPGGLPWLAWLAICLAGSGRQQQRSRPQLLSPQVGYVVVPI